MVTTGRLSSKERILTAISGGKPDRVPLYLRFFDAADVIPPPLRWSNQFQRAEKMLYDLGVDDMLSLNAPAPLSRSTKTTVRKESSAGDPCPLLVKEYGTPKGTLRQVVRQTPDWPFGDDIRLVSDYNPARSVEFLVKGPEDLDSLRALFGTAADTDVSSLQARARETARFAAKHGLAVEGWVCSAGTTAYYLMRIEQLLEEAFQRPEFVRDFITIIHEWQMEGLKLLLDTGVCDTVAVHGVLEDLQFWSPAMYRDFFFDSVREKVELIHQVGAKCVYMVTSRVLPLAGLFRELGFDALRNIDPVQGETDLPGVKRELGGEMCLIGGVNGPVTVGGGGPQEVREAVTKAIEVLAPSGGFILTVADCIYGGTPWENVVALIQRWKEIARYAD